jgi:hypothetical protein
MIGDDIKEVIYFINYNVSCGVQDKTEEQHLSLSSMDVVKGD